jgi:1,4-alpha-glucan branching enzyme
MSTTPEQIASLKPTNVTPQPVPGVIDLSLFAPYNEVVELLGNWNDWKPINMIKGKDGWWRATVELPDGDYLYKFRVKSLSYFAKGKMLEAFDPYALSVTDEASESTILRVRNGKRTDLHINYQWKHDDVPLPVNRDAVIYELHVGDFCGKKSDKSRGQFKDVVDRLDYLKELGINCLELMPVKEFPGKGWGYTLRSLFAVENSYGAPEELCRLVDEAHARGMRVIIDGVYNHANSESPLTKIDYEYWFYKDNPDPKEMQWGPKFNYCKYDDHLDLFPARKYVVESIQFWVEKFHVDGIRFDATRAIRDFDVMRELADAAFAKVNGVKPFICIAEHVPEDPAVTGRPNAGPMNAAWHDSWSHLMQAVIIGKEHEGCKADNLDELDCKSNPATNGYCEGDRFVNYLTSHDHKRAMYILGDDAKIFDDAAFRRMKMGISILMTCPGIPMLWMGAEFGFACDKTLDPCPLDWSLLENDSNRGLLEHAKLLTRIRHENSALRGDAFQVVLKNQERLLFAYKRWNDAGNVVLVVANLKDQDQSEFVIENAGIEDGLWHDAIHGNELKVERGVLRDVIGKSEVKVFIKK